MGFLKKLTQDKGETISEVLVATLIAAISMLIFASMVIASKNIIKDSRETIRDYYKQNSLMEGNSTEVKKYTNGEIIFGKAPVYSKKVYDATDGFELYSNEKNDASEAFKMIIYSY